MSAMKRGEVWWVSFGSSMGEVRETWPAVIVSNDASNKFQYGILSLRLESVEQAMSGQRCCAMDRVEQITNAVRELSPEDLTSFCAWFIGFAAEVWDDEFDNDVVAGRLNKLADEALNDLREGRCSDL